LNILQFPIGRKP